jgi:hypothetical protein
MEVNWSRFISSLTYYVIATNVPPAAGVYILYEELSDGSLKCIYVGETVNMVIALFKHLSEFEENKRIKNCVSNNTCGLRFASVINKQIRQGIVNFLIQICEPEKNKPIPNVKPIQVNLPGTGEIE